MRRPATAIRLSLSLIVLGLFAAPLTAGEPEFPGPIVPAAPFTVDGSPVQLDVPEECDTPPATLPRPLESLAARPLELPMFARQLVPRDAAPLSTKTAPGVRDWLAYVPALFTGPNLTIAGTTMLCAAGLLAGLALVLSSRSAKRSEETSLAALPKAVETAPIANISAAANVIPRLLQASLPVEPEPIYFPRGMRVFGRAIASVRYRLDAAHALREPHFSVPVAAENPQPAWGDAVWISVRTLDGAEGPHFAPHASAERPAAQPERSTT
ncbi:MAG: hypothetical protein ACT4QC_21345 [Planctomycetaceae bacterium]